MIFLKENETSVSKTGKDEEHMAVTLNDTPSANRLHIGVFGKTNSGKSSFINAFTNQEVSIVADIAGTTTDPVYKAMEIHPLGPCTIIDTAGFDDESTLGEQRIERTKLAAEKTDLAVILFAADEKQGLAACAQELKWYRFFKEKNTPVLLVINKVDLADAKVMQEEIKKETREDALVVSTKTGGSPLILVLRFRYWKRLLIILPALWY